MSLGGALARSPPPPPREGTPLLPPSLGDRNPIIQSRIPFIFGARSTRTHGLCWLGSVALGAVTIFLAFQYAWSGKGGRSTHHRQRISPPPPPPPHLALALEGGGFRALTNCAGLTAGLLAATFSLDLESSELHESVRWVSSVSGGSWFAASLIYSRDFRNMVERMARDPDGAGATFDAGWTSKWTAGAEASPVFAEALGVLGKGAGSASLGLMQDFKELSYLWQDGRTWGYAVATFLERTAGIGPNVTLRSPVQQA